MSKTHCFPSFASGFRTYKVWNFELGTYGLVILQSLFNKTPTWWLCLKDSGLSFKRNCVLRWWESDTEVIMNYKHNVNKVTSVVGIVSKETGAASVVN